MQLIVLFLYPILHITRYADYLNKKGVFYVDYIKKHLEKSKSSISTTLLVAGASFVLYLNKAYGIEILLIILIFIFFGFLNAIKDIKFYERALDLLKVEETIYVQKIEERRRKSDGEYLTYLYSLDSREFFLQDDCLNKVATDNEVERLHMMINTDAEDITEADTEIFAERELEKLAKKVVSGESCKIRYIKTDRWSIITDIEKIDCFN